MYSGKAWNFSDSRESCSSVQRPSLFRCALPKAGRTHELPRPFPEGPAAPCSYFSSFVPSFMYSGSGGVASSRNKDSLSGACSIQYNASRLASNPLEHRHLSRTLFLDHRSTSPPLHSNEASPMTSWPSL
ncbi:hypothetical protein E2C01_061031 [Portunus trituberculatus]|uniref:Uncharacterized protein n=1 Tax=Portunus trituberculatus TaxID=210409 RepID=A0A5B7HAA1_PORTR|nr:hypothetical protein [Portunus trituberculatus]